MVREPPRRNEDVSTTVVAVDATMQAHAAAFVERLDGVV
jgi:hypothetical protein